MLPLRRSGSQPERRSQVRTCAGPILAANVSEQRSKQLRPSVEVAKRFHIHSFTKVGLTASYDDGRNLDRFSRYQPLFSSRPRIRSIPGGADTFNAVGVVGGSCGFNVMEFVKFEGIYNHAWAGTRASRTASATPTGSSSTSVPLHYGGRVSRRRSLWRPTGIPNATMTAGDSSSWCSSHCRLLCPRQTRAAREQPRGTPS
jgi:hypothetical protein